MIIPTAMNSNEEIQKLVAQIGEDLSNTINQFEGEPNDERTRQTMSAWCRSTLARYFPESYTKVSLDIIPNPNDIYSVIFVPHNIYTGIMLMGFSPDLIIHEYSEGNYHYANLSNGFKFRFDRQTKRIEMMPAKPLEYIEVNITIDNNGQLKIKDGNND